MRSIHSRSVTCFVSRLPALFAGRTRNPSRSSTDSKSVDWPGIHGARITPNLRRSRWYLQTQSGYRAIKPLRSRNEEGRFVSNTYTSRRKPLACSTLRLLVFGRARGTGSAENSGPAYQQLPLVFWAVLEGPGIFVPVLSMLRLPHTSFVCGPCGAAVAT